MSLIVQSTKAEDIRQTLKQYAEDLDKFQRESGKGISCFRMQFNVACEALNILNETELYMLQKTLNNYLEK